MKSWVILLVRNSHVPEAPHPPLVEWKKLPYGETVLGQASGACMFQDSTRRAKVMGLIIPMASEPCSERLHATSAQLFGKCPPSVTNLPPLPGTRIWGPGTSVKGLQLHAWLRAWIWGWMDPGLNPISATSSL